MKSIDEKIAAKYARALFESFELEQLDHVEKALDSFCSVWSEAASVREILLNPAVLASEKRTALLEIGERVAQDAGVEPADNFARFLVVIDENSRLAGVSEIAKSFSALLRQLRQELDITIISAQELDSDEQSRIEKTVRSASTGLSQIKWEVDASLIGGVVVRCGDRELDGSVYGAIQTARSALLG